MAWTSSEAIARAQTDSPMRRLSGAGDRSSTVDERAAGRTVSTVANPPVDPDAFDAFEAAGWEEKAVAYERFFGVITDRVVAPLLAAASAGVGARVLDVGTGRAGWPPTLQGAGHQWWASTSRRR